MKMIKMVSISDDTMIQLYRTNAPLRTVKSIAKMAIKAYNIGAGVDEHEFEIMVSLMRSIGYEMIYVPYSHCSEFNKEALVIEFS